MRFCLRLTIWYNIRGFHSVQSLGILPFLSPPSFTGAGPGGLAPHARRGVAPMVGAIPAPGTMNGGEGKGGVIYV